MRAVQSAQQMNPLLSTQGTTPGALANNPYLLQQLAASQSVSNALPTMMGQQQLIQQLTAVHQNPSLPPHMIYPQQSQLVQSKIEENRATDQIVALLMSAQQAQQPRIAPANSVQNLAVANVVQGSTNIPSNASSSVAAPAAAAVGNALNENEDEEEVGNNVVKSTRAIDQRWMIRFEELQQFKQVRVVCLFATKKCALFRLFTLYTILILVLYSSTLIHTRLYTCTKGNGELQLQCQVLFRRFII